LPEDRACALKKWRHDLPRVPPLYIFNLWQSDFLAFPVAYFINIFNYCCKANHRANTALSKVKNTWEVFTIMFLHATESITCNRKYIKADIAWFFIRSSIKYISHVVEVLNNCQPASLYCIRYI
jgi:hypothetical protein